MPDYVNNNFKEVVMEAGFNLLEGQDDVQVALVGSSFTEDQDGDEDMADINDELSGTGYTAGGQNIDNQAVTQDNTDNEGVFDGDDVTWTGLDAGTIGALIYNTWTGTAATSELIGHVDTPSNLPLITNGGDVTVQFAAEGILNIT